MIFTLSTSKDFYDEGEKAAFEQLGFHFKKYLRGPDRKEVWIIAGKPKVKVRNLKELMALAKNRQIVLTCKTIEIYNDYRE